MAESSGYGEAMPSVQERLEKYQHAVSIVRQSHSGRPVEEVREALLEACAAEGIDIWSEVADDAARLISNGE